MRVLYYVPNMHDKVELAIKDKFAQLFEKNKFLKSLGEIFDQDYELALDSLSTFWDDVYLKLCEHSIFDDLPGSNSSKIYIYPEGVRAGASPKEISLFVKKYSSGQTMKFVKRMVDRGVEIRGAEDIDLLRRQLYFYGKVLKTSSSVFHVEFNKLIRARDNAIARFIDKSLPEDSKAIVLMGGRHNVPKSLRAIKSDIHVVRIETEHDIPMLKDFRGYIESLYRKVGASR